MRTFLLSIALAAVVAGGARAQTEQRVCSARFVDGRVDTVVFVIDDGRILYTLPLDLRAEEITSLQGCSPPYPLPEQAGL